MPYLKTILVGIDFSEFSRRASKRAGMLGRLLNADTVDLLTVKEGGLPGTLALVLKNTPVAAEALLVERSVRELALISAHLEDNYGIRCTKTVRFGRPEKEIAARADELPADLTVVGEHGSDFFTSLFLGNMVDKLARTIRTPLLVVKKEAVTSYRRVLVPVDFSENSKSAARMALEIAPDAQIDFLHVFDVVLEEQMRSADIGSSFLRDYHIEAEENARRDLNQFIADIIADIPGSHPISREVVFGHPGHVIYDHAESTQPDLIVLGKHGKSGLEELLLGSVSRHVLEQSSCDVLIVMGPRGAERKVP
jgi:nucleotide-binding universal stress UspA family protein